MWYHIILKVITQLYMWWYLVMWYHIDHITSHKNNTITPFLLGADVVILTYVGMLSEIVLFGSVWIALGDVNVISHFKRISLLWYYIHHLPYPTSGNATIILEQMLWLKPIQASLITANTRNVCKKNCGNYSKYLVRYSIITHSLILVWYWHLMA